jgi:hypothetical protein
MQEREPADASEPFARLPLRAGLIEALVVEARSRSRASARSSLLGNTAPRVIGRAGGAQSEILGAEDRGDFASLDDASVSPNPEMSMTGADDIARLL